MRIKLKKILCTTDLSEFSNAAIPYAVSMAEEFDARLVVGHVIELHTAGLYAEACLDPLEIQNQHMDFIRMQFDQLLEGCGIDWEPAVGLGYPPEEIVRMSREYAVDLVVTATHGRSGIRRLLLGSVTERLMRTLPCPSLTVMSRTKDTEPGSKRDFKLRRIMVGCDFSPNSRLALHYALSFAQEFQAELHLVHVTEPVPGETGGQAVYGDAAKDAEYGRRIRDRIEQMIPDSVRNWCHPVVSVTAGRPHETLVRYAVTNDIDMIHLGIRGHGLMEAYLVGSTTDRVVRQSPCPVLSVRPLPHADTEAAVAEAAALESQDPLVVDEHLFASERHAETVVIRMKPDFMRRAMDLRARDAMLNFLNRIDLDPSVSVVVMIGASDKTGSGEYAALYEQVLKAELDRNAIHRLYNVVDQIVLALSELSKIVVHADSGQVISLYLNMSLACDFRIVAEETCFQNPCLNLGMIPKGGGPFFLSRIMGTARALDWLLANRDIPASEALEKGVVDKVVPEDKLKSEALATARQFAQKPATSLRGVKRLLNFSHRDLRDYLELENQELLGILSSPQLPGQG